MLSTDQSVIRRSSTSCVIVTLTESPTSLHHMQFSHLYATLLSRINDGLLYLRYRGDVAVLCTSVNNADGKPVVASDHSPCNIQGRRQKFTEGVFLLFFPLLPSLPPLSLASLPLPFHSHVPCPSPTSSPPFPPFPFLSLPSP